MINVGIVGLGFMAATHIKAYRSLRMRVSSRFAIPADGIWTVIFQASRATWATMRQSSSTWSQVKPFQNYAEMLAIRRFNSSTFARRRKFMLNWPSPRSRPASTFFVRSRWRAHRTGAPDG